MISSLKLLARLCRLAGYRGLLVCIDELVALYRHASAHALKANYEAILNLINEAHDGTAVVSFAFGVTPDALINPHRGLYSYAALYQRLAENRFATPDHPDFTGPVMRLSNLRPEELFELLRKLRHIVAAGDPARHSLDDDGLEAFMTHCSRQVGDRYVAAPRLVIKEFVGLLVTLDQHPDRDWKDLLPRIDIAEDRDQTSAADPAAAAASRTEQHSGDTSASPSANPLSIEPLNSSIGDLNSFEL